eukprot:gene49336-11487_t
MAAALVARVRGALIGQRVECYEPGDAALLRRLNAQLLLVVEQGVGVGASEGSIGDDAQRWLHAAPPHPARGEFYR